MSSQYEVGQTVEINGREGVVDRRFQVQVFNDMTDASGYQQAVDVTFTAEDGKEWTSRYIVDRKTGRLLGYYR